MALRIILEDERGREVECIATSSRGLLTIHDEGRFPLLSRLGDSAYDVFSSADMPQLLSELAAFRGINDYVDVLSEIERLARHCENSPGWTVTFTPFVE